MSHDVLANIKDNYLQQIVYKNQGWVSQNIRIKEMEFMWFVLSWGLLNFNNLKGTYVIKLYQTEFNRIRLNLTDLIWIEICQTKLNWIENVNTTDKKAINLLNILLLSHLISSIKKDAKCKENLCFTSFVSCHIILYSVSFYFSPTVSQHVNILKFGQDCFQGLALSIISLFLVLCQY